MNRDIQRVRAFKDADSDDIELVIEKYNISELPKFAIVKFGNGSIKKVRTAILPNLIKIYGNLELATEAEYKKYRKRGRI